jgi:hypothetical protein
MTRKRYAKLLRAFLTNYNEDSKARGLSPAKDLYRAVRAVNNKEWKPTSSYEACGAVFKPLIQQLKGGHI